MQRFKLGFRNKSALEQLVICERTVASLAARPEDQADPAHLMDASDTVTALRASHQRLAVLRTELREEQSRYTALQRAAREKVTRASLGAASKVEFDPAKMLALGLELEGSKTAPVGKAAAPENFRAAPTASEGEARLSWVRPLRRCSFEIEYCTDTAADKWTRADPCLRQTCVIGGLKSGGKYWFRVRACNAHGEGPWSGLAIARVK